MNVYLNRKEFLAALELAYQCAPRKSPKPILTNVLIEADSNSVTITATDLDVSVRSTLKMVDVCDVGSCVLSPVALRGFLKASKCDSVRLESSEEFGATLSDEVSKTHLPLETASDYPARCGEPDTAGYRIPAPALCRLFELTQDATDTEASRYALGGVQLEFSGGKLIAVGTDGRRLAVAERPVMAVGEPKLPECCVLPLAAIKLIRKALGKSRELASVVPNVTTRPVVGNDNEETGEVVESVNSVTVTCGSFKLHTRLIEGRYPRWRDCISSRDDAQRIYLRVGELRDAVKRVLPASTEEHRGVDFEFTNDRLTLSAGYRRSASTSLRVPYNSGAAAITLDPRFVLSCLDTWDKSDVLTLKLVDENKPSFWTADGYTCVIMPLARNKPEPEEAAAEEPAEEVAA